MIKIGTIKVLGSALYQWELGRKVQIHLAPHMRVAAVQFAHMGDAEALNVEPREENGIIVADIPNILLQSGQKIAVFLVDVNENKVETTTHAVLPVIPRPRPTDYVYTETEVLSWQALEARVIAFMDEMNEAREAGAFDGDSAYDIAVKNGYEGTEEEWIEELQGNAAKSAEEAKQAAEQAAQSAAATVTQANAATEAQQKAEVAKGKAEQAQAGAELSATNADLSATRASEAAQTAELFGVNAVNAAKAAGSQATAADGAMKAAKKSETNAAASAEEAKQAASAAEGAAQEAEAAQAAAEQAQAGAEAAKAAASNSEKNAEQEALIALRAAASSSSQAELARDSENVAGNMARRAESAADRAEEAQKAAEEAKNAVQNAGCVKTVNGVSPDSNGNVQIEVGSGSGVEVTAKPGQLIRVKETDENGKPTAWEAVPWGYTEGGMVEILSERMTELQSSEFFITKPFSLTIGETYIVNWNGMEYTATAIDGVMMGLDGKILLINDGANLENGEGAVFLIVQGEHDGGTGSALPMDGSTELTLSIYQDNTVFHPIPGELLQEGVPYVENGGMVEILPETTIPLEGGEGMISSDALPLVVGQTYVVTWDGVEYTYVAEDASTVFPGAIMIGGFDQAYPGAIGAASGMGTFVSMNDGEKTETTISIIGESVKVNKIDPRCLPDGVGGVSLFDVDFTLDISGSNMIATTTKTFAEIYAKANMPNTIVRGVGSMGNIKTFFNISVVNESLIEFYTHEQSGDGLYAHFIKISSDDSIEFKSVRG